MSSGVRWNVSWFLNKYKHFAYLRVVYCHHAVHLFDLVWCKIWIEHAFFYAANIKSGEYLESMQKRGEDDDVCERNPLCHKESTCQQVRIEKPQCRQ